MFQNATSFMQRKDTAKGGQHGEHQRLMREDQLMLQAKGVDALEQYYLDAAWREKLPLSCPASDTLELQELHLG